MVLMITCMTSDSAVREGKFKFKSVAPWAFQGSSFTYDEAPMAPRTQRLHQANNQTKLTRDGESWSPTKMTRDTRGRKRKAWQERNNCWGAPPSRQLAGRLGIALPPVGSTRVTGEGTCGCAIPELLRQRLEAGVQFWS